MKKIKILYTIPNFDTAGCAKVVYDLIASIDKRKFDIEVLIKHTKGELFKEVEKLRIPIHVFNYEANYYPLWSLPYRILKISAFLKKMNVDIIHSWHWSSDFTEPLAARLAGIKYIYTKKNMSWGNKAWSLRSRLSNSVVTINSSMKPMFFDNYKNIEYIPIGIDTSYYQPIERKYKVDGIEIDDKSFAIITVANMVPVKGIEILIRSFIQVENELNLRLKLFLVGGCDNEYGKKLRTESASSDNIHFLGKKLDVRPYLAEADLFVIPTLDIGRKEAQGVAPLEAMSMGIPVVASNLDGLREVMTGYESDLFEPGNEEELKNKVKKHLKRKKNSTNRKKIEFLNVFKLSEMIKSYEKLYLEI